MEYSKTNWVNGQTPINETNLNKIENELEIVDKSLKYMGDAPSDLNDAKTFGIYHLGSTYTNAPISEAVYGILIVYQNKGATWNPTGGSWIWQEIRTTSGTIYIRNAVNSSDSWSEWKQVNKKNNNRFGMINLVGNHAILGVASGTIDLTESIQYYDILVFQIGEVSGYNLSNCVAMPFIGQFGNENNENDGWRLDDTIKLNFFNGTTASYITLKINNYNQLEIVSNPSNASIRGVVGLNI